MLDTMQNFLRSRLTLWIAALSALVVLLLVSHWLGWLGALAGSPWLWVGLVLLAAAAIFAGLYWGVPWLQERRFLRKESSEYVVAGEQSPEEFRAKFAKALQMLHTLPQLKGKGDPLYALPWYLLIGPGQSGKSSAVQGATVFSPLFTASGNGSGTQNYDWWVSNAAVVLDTAGRYALQVNVERDRSEWYRLLRLLRHHREREPINGVIIAVAADWLATQPDEQLRADASKLRDRMEESRQELGVDFPLYLLVTKCDLIEGFGEFLAQLPERVRSEVIGYVDDADAAQRDAALDRLQTGLTLIYDRLHLFRSSLLDGSVAEALRPAIFCFPEEFKALQRPLKSLIEPLLSKEVRYHTPLFRGIFFSSAQQTGARVSLLRQELRVGGEATPVLAGTKRYFLSDLFESILPRDRALAATTPQAQRRKGLLRAGRAGALLIIVIVATTLLARAYLADRRIATSVDPTACPAGSSQPASSPQIDVIERCRQAVESIAQQNTQRSHWSTQLFNRSGQLENSLRQRYVQAFQNEVVAPLNSALDRGFEATGDPLALMLLVARRVQGARRCLSQVGCNERTVKELQPDYALMLGPSGDRRAPPDAIAKLEQGYPAYLLWQSSPKEELQRDLADDQKRLRLWLTTKQFSLDNLLPLVNKQSPPITYDDYWELPAPITASAPQVQASCTKKVWEQEVAPFLQQLQDAVPDATPQLRAFQAEYRSTCLTQWQHFLATFAAGVQRARGPEPRHALALRLLTPESPCLRIIDDALMNLAPWLPAAGDPTSTPAWASQLKRYAVSEQRKAYQDALKALHTRLERGTEAEAALKLAQEVYTGGTPTQESANPILRASWAAGQAAPASGDAPGGQDTVLKPLLEEPLRYVWSVILDDAASAVQQAWANTVIAPIKGLPPAEEFVQLYGPGGKVGTFGEQFLKPFLADDPSQPNKVLGQALPLSPQFTAVLTTAKELKPVLDGGNPPQPIPVTATRPSRIEAQTNFRGEETVLSVTCGGKSYRITNRAQEPAEATTMVPWSSQGCGDASITIYFYAGEAAPMGESVAGAKRMQLTKAYSGRGGFLQFLQDFATGSHRFLIDELSGDPDVLRSGVTAITVSYAVEIPPTLTKLVAALQEGAPPEDIVLPSS